MSFPENTKRLAVKLRAKAEKMVLKKHPWIFRITDSNKNDEF